MLEKFGAISIVLGIILGVVSFLWLLVCQFKVWFRKGSEKQLRAPFALLVVAGILGVGPILLNSVVSRNAKLGPLNPVVNGERHLTLTGWNRSDYSVIVPLTDTVVLQMANPDVKDSTLKYVADFSSLREIDLSHTQITDASLEILARFGRLNDLRLAETKITDEGFRKYLLGKESLKKLDLTGTSVSDETIDEWKAAKPDRKVLK